jgi:hypothetical protein
MSDPVQRLLHSSDSERVDGDSFTSLMYPVAIEGTVELLGGFEWSSSSETDSSSSESTDSSSSGI